MPDAKPTASSVKSFCQRYDISEPTFYRHRASMPACIRIGGQLRITQAAEQQWLEQAAQGRAA
ncbi:MerR family transcriptional regulator [Thiorhodovibrio frisius]|nr:hypothetical protein [Thiorhodovibrio frisius]